MVGRAAGVNRPVFAHENSKNSYRPVYTDPLASNE